MKTNDTSAAAHRFAIVFSSGKHNNDADLEKHTKALQDYCKEIRFCTQQEFDNFKAIAAQMWPGLVSNAIAPALVKRYVAERGLLRQTALRQKTNTVARPREIAITVNTKIKMAYDEPHGI
jgi:hypothetical protein